MKRTWSNTDDVLLQIVFPTVYVIIAYFMTDQPCDPMRFFLFLTMCVMISLVAQSFGLVIGASLELQVVSLVIVEYDNQDDWWTDYRNRLQCIWAQYQPSQFCSFRDFLSRLTQFHRICDGCPTSLTSDTDLRVFCWPSTATTDQSCTAPKPTATLNRLWNSSKSLTSSTRVFGWTLSFWFASSSSCGSLRSSFWNGDYADRTDYHSILMICLHDLSPLSATQLFL